MAEQKKRRRGDLPLDKPNSSGNVWPRQTCPAFTPRVGTTMNECWYCRYADFHLTEAKALEVGICYWPDVIAKDT